ncbi:MAG: TetR/AcrR family transcriptional regulator [Solirubrobacterales bacterium]|nr:TetR/AcrR family transcriptional regulator [Solirubrobacterales bacterium]OJU94567.1 MAG: TetR family transcriptional regulator [Solirubrobacterales bacterium 67-14]
MSTARARVGRPRSEAARAAILHAVDDLLVEQGYAAMTLKGIAERAGVSRQTIYRWWSTKAEILFEASWTDAEEELNIETSATPLAEITAYLEALIRFLAHSPAGAAYRALVGEAQQDAEIAKLLASRDVLGESAQRVIKRALGDEISITLEEASAILVGPIFFPVLVGRELTGLDEARWAKRFLTQMQRDQPPAG